MRWITMTVAMAMVLVWGVTTGVQARPTKRLDPGTQQCRVLDQGSLDWESEPWGMGGIKLRELCQSCHASGNDKGLVFIQRESRTSEGWNRVFANSSVKCARDGSWDSLSQEDRLLVNDYLYRNGSWTYNPNDADSCG